MINRFQIMLETDLFNDSDAILNFSPVNFVSNEPYILFLLQILWKSFNFQEVFIFGSCVSCLSKFMFL